MKYTMSKDGVMRTTVTVKVRLTREEADELAVLADARRETLEETVQNEACLGVEDAVYRAKREAASWEKYHAELGASPGRKTKGRRS